MVGAFYSSNDSWCPHLDWISLFLVHFIPNSYRARSYEDDILNIIQLLKQDLSLLKVHWRHTQKQVLHIRSVSRVMPIVERIPVLTWLLKYEELSKLIKKVCVKEIFKDFMLHIVWYLLKHLVVFCAPYRIVQVFFPLVTEE